MKSLIEEKKVIPFAIIVGSKGGVIVQQIWKFVWRGPTVIFNGMTSFVMYHAFQNNTEVFIKDKTIKPIFVLLKEDFMYRSASSALKLRENEWEFYDTKTYEYNSGHLVPTTILISPDNRTSDLIQKILEVRFPVEIQNSHYEEYPFMQYLQVGFDKYRPSGEICRLQLVPKPPSPPTEFRPDVKPQSPRVDSQVVAKPQSPRTDFQTVVKPKSPHTDESYESIHSSPDESIESSEFDTDFRIFAIPQSSRTVIRGEDKNFKPTRVSIVELGRKCKSAANAIAGRILGKERRKRWC